MFSPHAILDLAPRVSAFWTFDGTVQNWMWFRTNQDCDYSTQMPKRETRVTDTGIRALLACNPKIHVRILPKRILSALQWTLHDWRLWIIPHFRDARFIRYNALYLPWASNEATGRACCAPTR
jgi:hypothetical protein